MIKTHTHYTIIPVNQRQTTDARNLKRVQQMDGNSKKSQTKEKEARVCVENDEPKRWRQLSVTGKVNPADSRNGAWPPVAVIS